ncbi:MAG: hypothetical protein WDN08_13355 [Rhizomicrobium sp.]
MALDRSLRSLAALHTASTSRVLNLAGIAAAHRDDPEHASRPLFASPLLNTAIVLKHRVRSDETYLFPDGRLVVTKIIVPFDNQSLKAGGRSFFVGQRGYHETLRETGKYDGRTMEHDLEVLRIVDALPSLDPFLLREHLRSNGVDCADCYFAISDADRQQMHDHAVAQIRELIALATGEGGLEQTKRLVEALLSNQVDEKLEPLRRTLMLEAEDFREGVFSWRGFLYYKWCMEKLWPEVLAVLRAVRTVQPTGVLNHEVRTFLQHSRHSIAERVREAGRSVQRTLAVYDGAYGDLVRNGEPRTFRDFLLSAPHLFVDLGEKMGTISHIVSFWRFRFPDSAKGTVDAEELAIIFQDFNAGFAPRSRFG